MRIHCSTRFIVPLGSALMSHSQTTSTLQPSVAQRQPRSTWEALYRVGPVTCDHEGGSASRGQRAPSEESAPALCPCPRFQPSFGKRISIRRHEVDMRYFERLGQFIESHHGRVALAPFQSAQILLAESRACFDLLLSEVLFSANARKISSNQLSYIHDGRVGAYIF